MNESTFFKDNFDELMHLFAEEKPFVLFLGAGINCSFENMGWDDLLNYLMQCALSILSLEENLSTDEKNNISEILKNPQKFSVYQKATLIKKVLGENYIGYLQSYLYSNCNTERIAAKLDNPDNFLIEIAKLILRQKNIHAVVTYNYDNYLTTAINLLKNKKKDEYRDIDTIDIFRTIQQLAHKRHKLPIFHVHGFIPPPNQVIHEEAENLVLAMDEYFHNMIESFSWQTTTQLFYLNNYNCLFLGTSLDDWNMLRALAYSGSFSKAVQHYVLFRNEYYKKGAKVSMFMNRIKSTMLNDLGIKPIFTDTDNYDELAQIIIKLQQNGDSHGYIK